ncbi:MAG: geranylgeranylglycerol-phosphate geranylgeranyltransferase [Flavobacteriales bacterium]|nr:geranylgeranylglycerol-phosphate geranylgeranyltransferase [Flavobacteriales bacterium]
MAIAYLRLIRWPNLVIIGLIFILLRFGLIEGFYGTTLLRSCLTGLHWWLMASATVLIAASGNVVNDIFDQDIDLHNRSSRRIIGPLVTEEAAWTLYYVLSGLGLALGILLAYLLGNTSNGLVFLLALGGLWFYSYSYKRQFLIGNLVVAFLAGLTVYLPLLFEMQCDPDGWKFLPWMPFIVAYAFFAALSTLIREMVKDMEDIEGDGTMGCRTVPIVIGAKATKIVVSLLTLILMAAVARFQYVKWEENDMVSFFIIMAAVQFPAAMLLRMLASAQQHEDFHRASLWSKGLMVGGIATMLLFRLTTG